MQLHKYYDAAEEHVPIQFNKKKTYYRYISNLKLTISGEISSIINPLQSV